MTKLPTKTNKSLATVKLAQAHFFFIFAFVATTVAQDAAQLIAPDAVLQRWKGMAALAVVTTGVWYFGRTKKNNIALQKWLIAGLVLAGIVFASYIVYAERGMASPAVALYAIPIITSAALLNRSAVFAAAILSSAAYAYASVKYFVDFFNEGYKIQLYSTIGFYIAGFFVLAFLISAITQRLDDN